MKRILVTGADGQLGKSIQQISITYPTLKFIFKNSKELDITAFKSVHSIFKEGKFDFCINCAAYTNVEQAEKTPAPAYLINSEAVKNLAITCKTNNVFLIHISTDYVFDGEKNTPYTVDDKPNPINEYGKSKLLGEQYIQENIYQYLIIRTSWLYSEFGKNFVKNMIDLSKKRGKLFVIDDQIGTPTYARDLAKLTLDFVDSKNLLCGIYHFSNGGVASWYDFAKAIFEIKGIKIKLLRIETKDYSSITKRPKFNVLDKSKTKAIFNTKISDWKDSLNKCISFIDDNKI